MADKQVFKVVDKSGAIIGTCFQELKEDLESIGLFVTPILVWRSTDDLTQDLQSEVVEKRKEKRKAKFQPLLDAARDIAKSAHELGGLSPEEKNLLTAALLDTDPHGDSIPH